MTTIDNQEILQIGETLNMLNYGIKLFLTFDGKWYRVRTRLETFKKFKIKEKSIVYFSEVSICQ